MFILAVAAYFLLACSVIGLVLFPAFRDAAQKKLSLAGAAGGRFLHERLSSGKHGTASFFQGTLLAAQRTKLKVLKHPFLFSGCVAAITAPPLIALLFSHNIALEGFADSDRDVNMQIAELLKGEQLVPPPPPPPSVFVTQEVLQVRPTITGASRDWQLLRAEYAQRLLLVFKLMKEKYGYDMALLEGYRSPERQNTLAAMGSHVTGATAFQSYHQYGLAADVAFMRDGKLVISEKDPWAMAGYQHYGELAESVGLTWGGRWKMMDFGHTELRIPGTIKKS